MPFFKLESKSAYHGYKFNTFHFSLNLGQHAQYSHNSEHTDTNIKITKTHYIPYFYQKTNPIYDSIGASDKDIQRGTTLVIGI